MPSRKSGRGREILTEVWDGSGGLPGSPVGPPRSPGVVGTPSRKCRKGRKGSEALPEVWQGLGGVGRPYRKSGRCREAISEVQEGSEGVRGPP